MHVCTSLNGLWWDFSSLPPDLTALVGKKSYLEINGNDSADLDGLRAKGLAIGDTSKAIKGVKNDLIEAKLALRLCEQIGRAHV